jgi:CheY-like chemotaxis protein
VEKNRARHSVLIVEDDEDTRAELSAVLNERGLRVRTAANGHAAHRHLNMSGESYCMILVDLGMPVMDGFGLLDALRSTVAFREMRVVVMSGRERLEPLGLARSLSKPFSIEDIEALLSDLDEGCSVCRVK